MLQKRLEYGFSGYQVPFVPRAARSTRRRRPNREKAVDNQLCAFDLLATIAGELLEGESSQNIPIEKNQQSNVPVSDVFMEEQDEGKMLSRAEHCEKVSSEVASLNHDLGSPIQVHDRDGKEIAEPQNDTSSALGSMITSSHCLETNETPVKSEVFVPGGKGVVLPGNGHDMYSLAGPEFSNGPDKFHAAASSDCSIKLSLGVDHCGSPSPSRDNNVNVVTRDDDENSSECTQPSIIKSTRLPARVNNRRIRKLLASKYWRITSKVKDGDHSETDLRCIYRHRKTGYKRQRSQRIYPFKKRKLYHYKSLSNSDGDTGCNGVYDSRDRVLDQMVSAFSTVKHGVIGSSSCVAGKGIPFGSRESHVKLRIKSFRVPELFIEMPETATVGSLKRAVMDAVTSLLGGGLHVGVLLQGKKIRDDNRTLVQSGICGHDEMVESLGFTLEPNLLQENAPTCTEDNLLAHCVDVPQPISRCPTTCVSLKGTSLDHMVTNVGNLVESDHDSTPSPIEFTAEKGAVDYRALVALPEDAPQALAVVPALQKSKQSDMAQRRIRRPFSVSEVEALVQAVEKLGTGRWRDVKLRGFENAKHRTYVDLKDKWKTLVHTARIAPQQRRGEPVPQELLDRVLSAHSYWSEQQSQATAQTVQPLPPLKC